MADAYLEQARRLKQQNPNLKPQDIIQEIGQPSDDKRLESKGHGKIGYKGKAARRAAKSSYEQKRQKNLRLRQPQTKEEENQRRRQNYKRSGLRRQGVPAVIDHRIPLDRLGETVEGKTPEEAKQRIEELEEVYGPLGDRPQNRVIRGEASNEKKRQQEAEVQRRLGEMEKEEPSSPESLAKSQQLTAEEVRELVGFNESLYTGAKLGMQILNGGIRLTKAVLSVGAAMAGMK
jgi:hypothetical protein